MLDQNSDEKDLLHQKLWWKYWMKKVSF